MRWLHCVCIIHACSIGSDGASKRKAVCKHVCLHIFFFLNFNYFFLFLPHQSRSQSHSTIPFIYPVFSFHCPPFQHRPSHTFPLIFRSQRQVHTAAPQQASMKMVCFLSLPFPSLISCRGR